MNQIRAALIGGLMIFNLSISARAETPVVKVDGSSTVFPLTEAMAEEFQSAQKGKVRVTVGVSGTGGGFKKFCRGEIDVQNASRPIQTSEIETCKSSKINFLELPVAYDATAIVVNPKNDWLKDITVEELKKIWEPAAQGKVMKWSDVNPKWPNEKLVLYGAGSDSGTFDYFTEAIVGKAKSSRGDYTASENDNTLVTGISKDKYSLGYLPYSYYASNQKKLKAVSVKGVLPSKENVENGKYAPLSRPVFIYASESAMKKAEVKDFVNYYLKNAEKFSTQVKLVALPTKAYDLGQKHVASNKIGTVFAGHSEVGMKIEDLMKKEAK